MSRRVFYLGELREQGSNEHATVPENYRLIYYACQEGPNRKEETGRKKVSFFLVWVKNAGSPKTAVGIQPLTEAH